MEVILPQPQQFLTMSDQAQEALKRVIRGEHEMKKEKRKRESELVLVLDHAVEYSPCPSEMTALLPNMKNLSLRPAHAASLGQSRSIYQQADQCPLEGCRPPRHRLHCLHPIAQQLPGTSFITFVRCRSLVWSKWASCTSFESCCATSL